MQESIETMIEKARAAQKTYESFTQEQVDAIVRAIAKTVYDNAESLAKQAHEETGMGVYEDKVLKNIGKSRIIWNSLKGKKSVGIIERNESNGIIKVAKPMGVIGAVTPVTNPNVTPMSNAMFALKGRNAVIIAPHPKAKNCSGRTVDLINENIAKLGAPANLIQIIREPSVELTTELMKQVDVVVATGGMNMVKAAYSSGKPSFGVGAGNVQVILDRGIDFNTAAQKIILGRKFDNGIICSGEQSVICHEDDYAAVVEAFKANGAYYIDDQSVVDKFRGVLFENGHISRHVVGQSVAKIASMAQVEVPADAKIILLASNGQAEDILRKEKMCPVMVAFTYKTFDEAITIAQTNLSIEGIGHTAAVHSNNQANIEKAAIGLKVSRIVVNQTSATSAGGSYFNGFAPTNTLGCGSWGNNSISENLDYKHLINVQQIGMPLEGKVSAPTDEQVWAE